MVAKMTMKPLPASVQKSIRQAAAPSMCPNQTAISVPYIIYHFGKQHLIAHWVRPRSKELAVAEGTSKDCQQSTATPNRTNERMSNTLF